VRYAFVTYSVANESDKNYGGFQAAAPTSRPIPQSRMRLNLKKFPGSIPTVAIAFKTKKGPRT
jgi:hypothetical protein